MSLLLIRDAVVEAFKAAQLLQGIDIEAHGGRFDFNELDSYAVSAPTIRLAVLGARRANKGHTTWNANLVAYTIAGRDKHMLASERGLVMGSAVLLFLQTYSPADHGRPESIAYQNLYSAESRERNKHLGAVTWEQTFNLRDDAAAAALDKLLVVAATYDPAPIDDNVLTPDRIELPPLELPPP